MAIVDFVPIIDALGMNFQELGMLLLVGAVVLAVVYAGRDYFMKK
jgi:hypothetical protein